jgi:hypothetical protein
MPSGYTHDLYEGKKDVSFEEFALDCAKAFGACISLRDTPGAEIPDEFVPSTWHLDAQMEASARMASLQTMSTEAKQAAAEEKNRTAMREWEQRAHEDGERRLRLEEMLRQVKAWEPPSDEHAGLKTFMLEQLAESLRLDCGNVGPCPDLVTPEGWHATRLATAKRNLQYHREQYEAEVKRAEERTKWVQDLRASLAGSEVSS